MSSFCRLLRISAKRDRERRGTGTHSPAGVSLQASVCPLAGKSGYYASAERDVIRGAFLIKRKKKGKSNAEVYNK